MKLLPKKTRRNWWGRKSVAVDGLTIAGRKGGRVKKQRAEERMVDQELRQYAYH